MAIAPRDCQHQCCLNDLRSIHEYYRPPLWPIHLPSWRSRLRLDFEPKYEILVIVLNFIYVQKPLAMTSTTTTSNHSADRDETRCECGQLIAKVSEQGLELKCKRCK